MRSCNKFDAGTQKLWESLSTEPLYCNDCQGVKIDRDESQWRFCNGLCQKQLPDHHFIEEMVTDWKQRDSELEARCARCVLQIFRVLCDSCEMDACSCKVQHVQMSMDCFCLLVVHSCWRRYSMQCEQDQEYQKNAYWA